MLDFRIMPAQHRDHITKNVFSRYALVVSDHPLGVRSGYVGNLSREQSYAQLGQYYQQGDYIATWETIDEAYAAAYCLGLTEKDIQRVAVLIPERAI